jgi:hypothetical protein
VICKEGKDEAAIPAIGRIVDVEEDGLLSIRWYHDLDGNGKCDHWGLDSSALFGPPEHKICHTGNNLVTKAGKFDSFVQLSHHGKRWWNLAAELCDSDRALI